jgi:hypothetical protein
MKNYYTIEKFKQTFDSEGNEILTQVDAAHGRKTIVAKNRLSQVLAYAGQHGNASNTMAMNSSETLFTGYSIGITPYKFYSMSNHSSGGNTNWTDDSTVDSTTQGIVGTRITGQDDSIVSGTNTETHTFQSRFSAPATVQRTINTVFLGYIYVPSANLANEMFSSVVLDVPCYQETDEILIITYRYVYERLDKAQATPWNINNPVAADRIAQSLGMFGGYNDGTNVFNLTSVIDFSGSKSVAKGKSILASFATQSNSLSSGNSNMENDISYFMEGQREFFYDFTVSEFNGAFLSVLRPYSTGRFTNTNDAINYLNPMTEIALRNPLDSVVQNTFNKTKVATTDVTADVPFFSLSNVGTSIGALTLTDDLSSGDTSYELLNPLAEVVRVDVTTGGAAGTAEYKIAKKVLSSFAGTLSWEAEKSSFCFAGDLNSPSYANSRTLTNDLNHDFKGLPSVTDQMVGEMIKPLHQGEFVTLCQHSDAARTGLWFDTFDTNTDLAFPFHLNSTSLPAFTATDIRGMCTAEDGTIYVACAATGLWKLTRNKGDMAAAMTATLVASTGATVSTSCHGVNFGRYGNRFDSGARLVALFGLEMCISDDGGATWTMYNGSSTPLYTATYTPDNVTGVSVHPDHLEVMVYEAPVITTFADDVTPVGQALGIIHQWFGSTGTFDTRTGWSSSCAAISMYGGANGMSKPVTNAGTYKWTVMNYSGKTRGTLYLYNTISTVIATATGGSDDAGTYQLVYNETTDDSVIFYNDTTTKQMDYSEDYVNATRQTASQFLEYTNGQESLFLPMGRGLFLVTGSFLAYANSHYYDSVNTSGTSQKSLGCLINFALPNNFEKDFYVGNPLNLWYVYGWSGSAWVLDGTGSKVSGATGVSVPLINGLSVTFTDDSGSIGAAGNFIVDEIWDTYAYDGIIKDDYTSLSFSTIVQETISVEGNTFTPNVVPANGGGAGTRIQVSAEYYSYHTADEVEEFPYFSNDVVGFTRIKYNSNVSQIYNWLPIGPILGSTEDWTYEFKIGVTVSSFLEDAHSTLVNKAPVIYFTDMSTATSGDAGDFVWGLRGYFEPADFTTLHLVTFTKDGTSVAEGATIAIANYDPKVDVFSFVKDTGANTLTLLRNGVQAAVLDVLGLLNVSTRLHTSAPFGKVPSFTGAGTLTGFGNELSEIYLTYTDNRLAVKIGNGTTTGAAAQDYGRVLPLEYISKGKKIYLNGVEAVMVYDNLTNVPAAGEVKLNVGTGELIFNAADAGKVVTGDWRYLPSVNKKF